MCLCGECEMEVSASYLQKSASQNLLSEHLEMYLTHDQWSGYFSSGELREDTARATMRDGNLDGASTSFQKSSEWKAPME